MLHYMDYPSVSSHNSLQSPFLQNGSRFYGVLGYRPSDPRLQLTSPKFCQADVDSSVPETTPIYLQSNVLNCSARPQKINELVIVNLDVIITVNRSIILHNDYSNRNKKS